MADVHFHSGSWRYTGYVKNMPAQDIFSKLTEEERKDLAKHVKRAFSKMLRETSTEATMGSKAAALRLLQEMTAQVMVLRALGYETSDEGNRLIKWRKKRPDYWAKAGLPEDMRP